MATQKLYAGASRLWEMFIGDDRCEILPYTIWSVQRANHGKDFLWPVVINQENPSRRFPSLSPPPTGTTYLSQGTKSGFPYHGTTYRMDTRTVGTDISVYTFLSAMTNPEGVGYTEHLGRPGALWYSHRDAGGWFGVVCSTFTSYCMALGMPQPTNKHANFEGAVQIPNDISLVKPGDLYVRSDHTELITHITYDGQGNPDRMYIIDSTTSFPRIYYYSAEYVANVTLGQKIYRITDRTAHRQEIPRYNYPLSALPNAEDLQVNEVVLLDYGDRVNYWKNQAVKFNVMSADAVALVIKRSGTIIESVPLESPGVIERSYDMTGDYEAYCIMNDSSHSQSLEFIVVWFQASFEATTVPQGTPITVTMDYEHCFPVGLVGSMYADSPNYPGHFGAFVPQHRIVINRAVARSKVLVIPTDHILTSTPRHCRFVVENRFGKIAEPWTGQLITTT